MIKNKIKTQILRLTSSLSYGGSSVFLFYKCCQYLFYPKPDEAAQIYDFSVLIMFEFILNPCVLIFQMFIRHFWAKIGVVIFFSGFFFSFYTMLNDGAAIKWIILFIILNHFIFQTEEDNNMVGMYVFRIMVYFFLLFFIAFVGNLLPSQITKEFLATSNYYSYEKGSGLFLDNPSYSLYQGLFYYGILLFFHILLWCKGKSYWESEDKADFKSIQRQRRKKLKIKK